MTLVLRSNHYICFQVLPARIEIYNEWRKHIADEEWSFRIIEQQYNGQVFVYISEADFTDHVFAYVSHIGMVQVAFRYSNTIVNKTHHFMKKLCGANCNVMISAVIYEFGIRELYYTTHSIYKHCTICGCHLGRYLKEPKRINAANNTGLPVKEWRKQTKQEWIISRLCCHNCEKHCKKLWTALVSNILTRLLHTHKLYESALIKKILDNTHYDRVIQPHIMR